MTGTLHEDQYTFFIISLSIPLIMRNVSDKSCRGNQNTHFMFSNFFFFKNRAFYEIVWNKMVEPDRPQMTKWRMSFAFWIPKATNTHSEYVILKLLFHYNNGCTNGRRFYVIRTLSILFKGTAAGTRSVYTTAI